MRRVEITSHGSTFYVLVAGGRFLIARVRVLLRGGELDEVVSELVGLVQRNAKVVLLFEIVGLLAVLFIVVRLAYFSSQPCEDERGLLSEKENPKSVSIQSDLLAVVDVLDDHVAPQSNDRVLLELREGLVRGRTYLDLVKLFNDHRDQDRGSI